jgi:hypothetical protein
MALSRPSWFNKDRVQVTRYTFKSALGDRAVEMSFIVRNTGPEALTNAQILIHGNNYFWASSASAPAIPSGEARTLRVSVPVKGTASMGVHRIPRGLEITFTARVSGREHALDKENHKFYMHEFLAVSARARLLAGGAGSC